MPHKAASDGDGLVGADGELLGERGLLGGELFEHAPAVGGGVRAVQPRRPQLVRRRERLGVVLGEPPCRDRHGGRHASASPTLLWKDSTRRNRSSPAARMSPVWTAASRPPRTLSESVASVVSVAYSGGSRMSGHST
ncbi:hypothetical protein ABZ642_16285 [Streptomyces sp. NPDC007157]|uniref:hypothetical protein n=1 Tax=Streptomyces sp. NPDC007157 TaxID=3154681 RepID=UPI0033FF6E3A